MKKGKKCKIRILFKISFSFILLILAYLVTGISGKTLATETDFYYLSNIQYDVNQSHSGWKELKMDKAGDDSLISVKVQGAYYTFEKGIWAHAPSTVVYNLTGYDYDYFTAYIGLNKTAASSSNGVKFRIYTSANGTDWHLQTDENPKVFKAGDNAEFVKIDISKEKYLKLEADANGNNGNDHSVYADAKLIKSTYKEPGEELVPSIEQLNEKIKTEFVNADLSKNKAYEYTLLKREFIKM